MRTRAEVVKLLGMVLWRSVNYVFTEILLADVDQVVHIPCDGIIVLCVSFLCGFLFDHFCPFRHHSKRVHIAPDLAAEEKWLKVLYQYSKLCVPVHSIM